MALRRIYSARDGMQANFLRMLLEEEGISAAVVGDALAAGIGGLPKDMSTSASVWVHEVDVARARAVVVQFDARPLHRVRAAEAPWKCPNCGERIEGQFTDCWNCQMPRPGDAPSAEAAGNAGPADVTLNADLACVKCGYNLRGLTPQLRCPECGLPILRTLLDVVSADMAPDAGQLQRVLRQLFEAVGSGTGYTASALVVVCHVWLRVAFPAEPPEFESSPADFAGRVCVALRETAIRYFGAVEEARKGLRGWGINASEDLGKVIAGLMDAGIIEDSDRELLRGFVGLCSLDGLFMEAG